uniref:HTH myb-type domain-containing protein n=1 Tax=Leersia perrieri TaxID=77586 RepID=A0A0D9VFE9_9ORYZ
MESPAEYSPHLLHFTNLRPSQPARSPVHSTRRHLPCVRRDDTPVRKRFAPYATPRPRFPSLPFFLPFPSSSSHRIDGNRNLSRRRSMEVGRDGARRRCREYLVALEEERRKIQVFQRELPLCFDLVTQTIEGMRSQMDGAGSEETVSDQGPPPVLEEFIPLKPSLSLSSDEDEESTHAKKEEAAETSERHSPPQPEASKKVTPDWLQSVQLWSQEPHPSSPTPTPTPLAKDVPCKPVALNARKGGGAFHPFEKEKQRVAAELPASSTTAAAAASSTAVGDSGGDKATTDDETENHRDETDKVDAKDKEGQSQSSTQANRKPRRCWAPELHRRFLQALQQLGGSHVATPKQIRELMKVDGLTNDEVKSHLQKYRLHTRRPSSTGHSSAGAGAGAAVVAPPAPQFVVVGSIWVPPPEYAAAAAAQHAAAAADASGSANPVYAPVAMLPPGLQPHSHRKQQQQQGQRSHVSEGRRSGDAGDGSSSSPAVSSSSTQTTSA